jgi:hypothetical protein
MLKLFRMYSGFTPSASQTDTKEKSQRESSLKNQSSASRPRKKPLVRLKLFMKTEKTAKLLNSGEGRAGSNLTKTISSGRLQSAGQRLDNVA